MTRRGRLASVVVTAGLAACASRSQVLVPNTPRNECYPGVPVQGSASDFTGAGGMIDGVQTSPLVACIVPSPPGFPPTEEGAYVTLDLGPGPRRLRFQGGAVRCDDGVFRAVERDRRRCDAQPAAPEDAPVLADAFLSNVEQAWKKEGIATTGLGLLRCKEDEPMIAIGDYREADRAAALLIERARLWQLGGTLNLLVRGTPGMCLL